MKKIGKELINLLQLYVTPFYQHNKSQIIFHFIKINVIIVSQSESLQNGMCDQRRL